MYQIKRLSGLEELKTIQSIEQEVWNMPPIPIHQTYTAAQNGGIVLGAYKGEKLVGFQYSFPGFHNGKAYLCSHMLGILPAHRKSGLGREMKEIQRKLALEMGYSLIVWTFDPLESLNAYLNLHKLNGICSKYLENHYGEMTDSLNQGLHTDRFLVEWWIDSEHVKKQRSKSSRQHDNYTPVARTDLNQNGFPFIIDENILDDKQEAYLVPIPEDFQRMKKEEPDLTLEWRLKTRNWFQKLLQNDYVAEDVVRDSKRRVSYYVLRKSTSLALK